MRAAMQLTTAAVLWRRGLARTYSTRVMSFGDDSHGALGLSQVVPTDAYEPLPVDALPDNIIRVAAGHYHSLAIAADGQLWSWGRNNEGQLGRGANLSWEQCNRPELVVALKNVEVKDATGSGVVSMAIDVHGSLWAWGKSKRGQLGLGEAIVEAPCPCLLQALSGHQIVQVSLGWGHALACTAEGKVFSWGYPLDGRLGHLPQCHGSLELQSISTIELERHDVDPVDTDLQNELNVVCQWEPSLISLGSLEAIGVSCGFDHSLVICNDGILLSFGDNSYGQLGRSKEMENTTQDWRVKLDGHVSYVGSGLGHSLAVCVGCKEVKAENIQPTAVYSWGWNAAFQLGRTTSSETPMELETFKECQMVTVDGGRVHSAAVDSDGGLWTWGSGRNGRLGLGSFGDEQEPCLVESIQDLKVKQAVCGMDHTVILLHD